MKKIDNDKKEMKKKKPKPKPKKCCKACAISHQQINIIRITMKKI